MRPVFLLQLLATFALLGLIWFVQVVHYPLHLRVGEAEFSGYEAEHADRTGYIAGPLMILELLTAFAVLVPRWRPVFISGTTAWFGATLVSLLWFSTAFVQVPLHNRLHGAYSRPLIQQLVRTNWIRTALWTARSLLLCFWVYRLLPR